MLKGCRVIIMKKRDFNIYVAVLSFIAGALFVLSNDADITANVVGASGEGATVTALIGILIIIASAGFFVMTVQHGKADIETLVHRNDNKHTDLNKEHILKNEIEDKYGGEHLK